MFVFTKRNMCTSYVIFFNDYIHYTECPEGTDTNHQRRLSQLKIGTMPQMTKEETLQALQSSINAWNGGSGVWPQLSLSDRIKAVQNFVQSFKINGKRLSMY